MLLSTLERLVSILGSSAASDDPYDNTSNMWMEDDNDNPSNMWMEDENPMEYDNPLNMWMEEDDELLTEPLKSLEDLRVGELVKMVEANGRVRFIQILRTKPCLSFGSRFRDAIYYRDSRKLNIPEGKLFTNTEGLFVSDPITIRDCVPYDDNGGCKLPDGRWRPHQKYHKKDSEPEVTETLEGMKREKRRIEEAERIGRGRP